MTIKPVSTRLNRASAFELRSKTCAMSAFLLPLRHKPRMEVKCLQLSAAGFVPRFPYAENAEDHARSDVLAFEK